MEKNKKARKALRKSIKHWCLDIRRPLLKGDSIIVDKLWRKIWKRKKTVVRIHSDSCALCHAYDPGCTNCPLGNCNDVDGPYQIFRDKLDVDSANNMISILVKCYWGVI